MAAILGNTVYDIFNTPASKQSQQNINSCWSCKLGNRQIVQILAFITEILTTCIGRNIQQNRIYTDFKIIDVTTCKSGKWWLFYVRHLILLIYYYQIAQTRLLCEFTNGHPGEPTDDRARSERFKYFQQWVQVLAMSLGNPQVGWAWSRKSDWFSSEPIQTPDPLLLAEQNPDPYSSILVSCQVWLGLSGPISGSAFWVHLFMVGVRYPIDCRKVLTLVPY